MRLNLLPSRHLGSLLLILTMVGCQESPSIQKKSSVPFVFKSLELRHKQADGSRDWDLNSPLARYELGSRVVRARNPEGVLYKENKPSFEISAQAATVLNDGETVLLEGNVMVQQLTGEKVLIIGDRLRWSPNESKMVIEQRPQALDNISRISAKKVLFQQLTQELVFKGPTKFERWEKQRNNNQDPSIVIRGRNGLWNLDSGKLNAMGPILGHRIVSKNDIPQQLTATRLQGNTKKGYLDLIKPVTLMIPEQKASLLAQTTRWKFNSEKLESNQPFIATQEKSTYRGNSFKVDLAHTRVEIPQNCELSQPGEQLNAEKCIWNWRTEEVQAIGDVILKRDANNHITKSDKLEGRIGEEGTVSFSSSGSKVRSQLTIEGSEEKLKPSSKSSPPIQF
ncbi:hypothetical protein EV13_0625 [Prochlorococcus sp. MIT 0702]|uniref:LPS export ABC transporter periplasmic protein LptC n=2 Tax=unclassified Prochlorococcus TaxID=2627481 RepID=UPI0005336DD6|nr:hypothetical protein EV13_0625 [Prochlorococcus sp. MIT 0702]KGG30963.1 hypothetical protein EV14_2904 [Prochlorococcus sp. MIT 0703]